MQTRVFFLAYLYTKAMNIREIVPLSDHTTMRLGGPARYLTEITSEDQIAEAISFANEKDVEFVVIGDGSNVVWTDEGYNGLVIVNKLTGFDVDDTDPQFAYVHAAAGENWDSVVERCVELGLTGIESLSLVPGTCGAAPIQNIGAYGQEIADTIHEVHLYDTQDGAFESFEKEACNFSYRHSIFNTSAKGRYIITGITLKLFKSRPTPPFYRDVEAYLSEHDILGPTPQQLREAVIAIRTLKLPDPRVVANNGSFFHNPIVEPEVARQLLATYPELPNWEMNDGRFKLSAAWLIESAGFPKGYEDPETGMANWKNQALVLVNESAHSANDLFTFRDKIIAAVHDKFGLSLNQEPEIIT